LLSNSQNKVSECKVVCIEHRVEIEIVRDSINIHISISKDGVTITKSTLGKFVEGNITLLWDEFDKVVSLVNGYRGEVEHERD